MSNRALTRITDERICQEQLTGAIRPVNVHLESLDQYLGTKKGENMAVVDGKRSHLNIRQHSIQQEVSTIGQTVEAEVIPSLLRMLVPKTSSANTGTPQTQVSDWLQSLSAQNLQNTWQSNVNDTTAFPADGNQVIDQRYPVVSKSWMEPAEFVKLLTLASDEKAMALVAQLRAESTADEVILLRLLAPASIELGKRWDTDLNDFADVTLGVCRLHRILRSLHPAHERTLDHCAHGGRVLLAPTTGEQHSFGLLLISELLFRAGWYTDVNIEPDGPALPTVVKRNWYEMVGISVSCESRLQETRELITAIRRKSCNFDIAILVGGRVFADNESLGLEIGADQVVVNGATVATLASKYVPEQQYI